MGKYKKKEKIFKTFDDFEKEFFPKLYQDRTRDFNHSRTGLLEDLLEKVEKKFKEMQEVLDSGLDCCLSSTLSAIR